jgi:hypothetical protein
MNLASLKKLVKDNGVVAGIVLIVVLYALSTFYKYFESKGSYSSSEGAEMMKPEHKNVSADPNALVSAPVASAGIQPADEKPNEYSLVNEIQTMSPPTAGASSDLLPIDGNNQWAQLSPAGAGELQGINLLKSGYHIGIDTVGQTLRNANLQIRSEPPNPQINVGPWNQSTISPDLMRVPLELGCGSQ